MSLKPTKVVLMRVELDLLVEKAFMKHYTVGVKYADYNAGDLAGKVDTEKFWVYGQVKF